MRRPEVDALLEAVEELGPYQVALLRKLAKAMVVDVTVEVSRDSDLVTPEFEDAFTTQLVVHHVTHFAKLKKKAFEYVFKAACLHTTSRRQRRKGDHYQFARLTMP